MPTYKFSDIDQATPPPVDQETSSESTLLDKAVGTAKDSGIGVLKGAGSTIGAFDDWSLKHLPPRFNVPFGQEATPENAAATVQKYKQDVTPNNNTQLAGKIVEQVGENFLPTGLEEGVTKLGSTALGLYGALAGRLLGAAAHSGLVNKAQGGHFGTGALLGAGGAALSSAMGAAAPALFNTALGVRAYDKARGRDIGKFGLRETKGFDPETVRRTAEENIAKRYAENQALLAAVKEPIDMGPTHDVTNDEWMKAAQKNVRPLIRHVEDLSNVVNKDAITGKPIGRFIPAVTAHGYLQGLGNYLPRGSWNPDTANILAPIRDRMYGALRGTLEQAAPAIKENNEVMSNLLPLKNRAETAALQPGVLEHVLQKFKAPTGALAGAVGGGMYGYQNYHSLPGALAGAATGAVLPSVIASPRTQLFLARGADSPFLRQAATKAVPGTTLQLFDRDSRKKP